MKRPFLTNFLTIAMLLVSYLGYSQQSNYCELVIQHFVNADPSSEIKLTIENTGANDLTVSIESNNANPIDVFIIEGAGESSRTESNNGTVWTKTLTYTTPPSTVNMTILWSNSAFGGNWQLNMSDIPFAAVCNVDPADDVTLSDLTVDGTTISGFKSGGTSYTVEVPAGTTTVPTVVATPSRTNATAVVTPATEIPGTTQILVTSSNGNQTATVSIAFVINTPGVAAPTPIARDANEVVSIYANGYNNVTIDAYNPFGGSTYEQVTIAGRPTIKLSGLNFSHISLASSDIDVSEMTHVHFDYWTPDATSLRLRLETDGGAGANMDFQNSSLRKWTSKDIALADYSGANLNDIDYLIFTAGQVDPHDEILFLDNIYFYKAEVPSTIGALSKYCQKEIYHLNITDGSQASSAVNLTISNIDATSMFIELESATEAALTSTTIDPINGVTGTTVETNGVFRTTFTFTNPPATIAPVIQWNNGTNWIIRIADVDGSLPFSASCALPAAVNITASETTTADVTAGNLTVAAGQTYTVASGHTLSVLGDMTLNGNLVINSGGSLITSDGKTTGNVTIKRNTRYADGKYSFVGSPVNSDASITGSDLGSIVYKYNEVTAYGADGLARWEDAASTQLVAGMGYAQAMQKEISFTGIPNDGTITVSGLSHTAPDSKHDEHGWNLVSNPYPAAISVEAFLNNSKNSSVTSGSIYLWDDHGSEAGRGDNGDYLSVNSLGAVGGPNGGVFNGYIGSMQGFFVKIASPTADESIEFTESMRVGAVNTDASFFRQAAEGVNIKLSLSNSSLGYYNEILVGLRDDATLGIDRMYDADKLIGNDHLQFFSFINANKYAIQGLPFETGVSTELGFNLDVATELTFTVKEGGEGFFLTDRMTGTIYDLSEVKTFTFQASKGAEQNRFVLSYGSAAAILSTNPVAIQPVYRFVNSEMLVSLPNGQITSYAVYDMTGRVYSSGITNAVNQLQIPMNSRGVRIIKLETTKGTFTRKFLID